MDKQCQTIPNYIGQYKRSVYELYFNSVLKKKWVNSSRTDESMVDEILRTETIPHYILGASIVKIHEGETTVIWEYIKEQKPVYDMITEETYPSNYAAAVRTGIARSTIYNQCESKIIKGRRFRYL